MRALIYSWLVIIVCCFSAMNGVCQYPLGNSHSIVVGMKVVQERQFLIANLGGSIEVWNYDSKELVRRWTAEKITSIDHRNGRVAGASATGRVFVWDLESGSLLLEKNVASKPLVAIAWVNDENFVVGGENNSLLRVATSAGEVVAQCTHPSTITALMLGNDDALLVGDEEGNVVQYSSGSLSALRSNKGHHQWVRQIMVSDSLPSFYSASDDGRICTWKESDAEFSSRRRFGDWLLSADVVDFKDAKKRITAIGKRNGELIVDVSVGHYQTKLDAMITGVEIIERELPNIRIIVTTYGSGIQLWEAKEMKHRK